MHGESPESNDIVRRHGHVRPELTLSSRSGIAEARVTSAGATETAAGRVRSPPLRTGCGRQMREMLTTVLPDASYVSYVALAGSELASPVCGARVERGSGECTAIGSLAGKVISSASSRRESRDCSDWGFSVMPHDL